MVTLQLNHFSEFFVFNNGSVASEFLFENLQNFLGVEFLGETLDGCECLSTVSLLNANV